MQTENKPADANSQQAAEAARAREAAAKHLQSMDMTSESGAHLTFNEKGRLVNQETAAGTVKLKYAENGKPEKVTDKEGEWISSDGKTFTLNGKTRTLVNMTDGSVKFQDSAPTNGNGRNSQEVPPAPAPTREAPAAAAAEAAPAAGKVEPGRAAEQPGAEKTPAQAAAAEQAAKVTPEQTQATLKALGQLTGAADAQAQAPASNSTPLSGKAGMYAPPSRFDVQGFKELFAGKSDSERAAANQAFSGQYGMTLEQYAKANLSGKDLAEVVNSIQRKDGDLVGQRLSDLTSTIEGGASGWKAETNIRAIFSTSTKAQLDSMDQQYRAEHNGTGLLDALKADKNISDTTKAALDQLKSGSDHRTVDETLAMAKLGLDNKSLDIFREAMAQATPEARAKFLQNGGDKQITDAFAVKSLVANEGSTTIETPDSLHARDYANFGKLSAATQVSDNTGRIFSSDAKGVALALSNMTERERFLFTTGMQLANHPDKKIDGLSETDRALALSLCQELHGTLKSAASNDTQLAEWEDKAAIKDGSFVSSLARHRGYIHNDSIDEIKKMSPACLKRTGKTSKRIRKSEAIRSSRC